VSFDFASLLGSQERLVSAKVLPMDDGPGLGLTVLGPTKVQLGTPFDFDGPNRDAPYELVATIDSPSENYTVECSFAVRVRVVPTVFYVRVGPSEGQSAAVGPEPTPTPTPTPMPGPHYEVPAVKSADAQSPSVNSAGSSSPFVDSPKISQPAQVR
jgi:hypothetical protein